MSNPHRPYQNIFVLNVSVSPLKHLNSGLKKKRKLTIAEGRRSNISKSDINQILGKRRVVRNKAMFRAT